MQQRLNELTLQDVYITLDFAATFKILVTGKVESSLLKHLPLPASPNYFLMFR